MLNVMLSAGDTRLVYDVTSLSEGSVEHHQGEYSNRSVDDVSHTDRCNNLLSGVAFPSEGNIEYHQEEYSNRCIYDDCHTNR